MVCGHAALQLMTIKGWRRSGCFLYKPEMERTCCPSYTIRLRVNDFVPSKEQQRVFRRMQRNLLVESGQDLLYSSNIAFQIASTIKRVRSTDKEQQKLNLEDTAITAQLIAEKLVASVAQLTQRNSLTVRACNGHLNFYGAASQLSSSESNASGSEESVRGCKRKGCCLRKNIEHLQGKKRKLEVRLKRSSFDPEEFALYRRYQIQVHNDAPDHVTESSYKRFLVDSPLVFVPPSGDSRVPPCGFGSFHQQYVVDGHLIAVGVVDILPRCLSSKYLFWDPDYAFLSLGKYSASQEIDWVKVNQVHCPSLQHYYLGYYIHSCNKMRYKAAYRPSELLCPLRYQWVPFDVAKPWLDRKAYVVLSDISLTENGESLPPHAPEKVTEDQHDDNVNEDMNDSLVDENEEMVEPESDSSDDETDPEISGYGEAVELEDGNIDDTLIGLKGTRLRYQDLKAAFGAKERKYLESQLHRYRKVVGSELSKKIVYSLG
ncbi:Arginyl-tRNA--protein transferase 1 [Linum perenne]